MTGTKPQLPGQEGIISVMQSKLNDRQHQNRITIGRTFTFAFFFLLLHSFNSSYAQFSEKNENSLAFFLNSTLSEKRLNKTESASLVYTLAEEQDHLQNSIESYFAFIAKDHRTEGNACRFEINEIEEPEAVSSFSKWKENKEAAWSFNEKQGRFAFGFTLKVKANASQSKETFENELPVPTSYPALLNEVRKLVTQNQTFGIPLGTLYLGEKFIDSLGQEISDFKTDLDNKVHFPISHLVLKPGFYGDPEHLVVFDYQNHANKKIQKPLLNYLSYYTLHVHCPLRKKPRKILVCDQESKPAPAEPIENSSKVTKFEKVASAQNLSVQLLNEHRITSFDTRAFSRLKQDPVHLHLPLEQEQKLAQEGWDSNYLKQARAKKQVIIATLNYNLISCEDHQTEFATQVDYQVGQGEIENGYLHFVYHSSYYQGCTQNKEGTYEAFTYANSGISENWDVEVCNHAHFEEEP